MSKTGSIDYGKFSGIIIMTMINDLCYFNPRTSKLETAPLLHILFTSKRSPTLNSLDRSRLSH